MAQKHLNDPKICKQQKHNFHIVKPYPWPLLAFASLLNLAICSVLIFNQNQIQEFWLGFSIFYSFSIVSIWSHDIITESHQDISVKYNLRYSFNVFLISETMFLFGFFWYYFYMSLSPSIWIGCTWPPKGIISMNPMHLPLFNTILLAFSGVSVVFAHKAVMRTDGRKALMNSLAYAIGFGLAFIVGQLYEYHVAEFFINDGIFGSVFYVLIGFHSVHVIIGIVILFAFLIKPYSHYFLHDHHIGLELTFWYWHFVDAIWILLYLFIYVGSFDFDTNYFYIEFLEPLYRKLSFFFKNENIIFFIIFNFLVTCLLLYFFGDFLEKNKSLYLSYINIVLCMFLMAGLFFSVFFKSNATDYVFSLKVELPYNYFIEIIVWETTALELVLLLVFHFYWHFFFILIKDYHALPEFLFYINFLVLYSFLYNILANPVLQVALGYLFYAKNSGLFEALWYHLKEKIKIMRSYINNFLSKWPFRLN